MDCSSITDFQQSTAIRIAKKFRNLHIGKKESFFFSQIVYIQFAHLIFVILVHHYIVLAWKNIP